MRKRCFRCFVWGPKYHHPEWHNDGDSAKMLPTITEWWESPDSTDSVAAAIRNYDHYLQYRRMDELRITFMKDLVDTGCTLSAAPSSTRTGGSATLAARE